MRALHYYGKEDVRLEDVQEPQVRPGTVKIAPAYTGICGSDLSLFFTGPIPPMPSGEQAHPLSGETMPVVFGHEFSGVVEELGEGVHDFEVGDHVVVEPLMVCGECPACRTDQYNLCAKLGFIGISGLGGGLSEHIVVDKRWVHGVGELPLDQAALIEPLAVAVHGVRRAKAQPEQVAVVGGAGPIGLLTAAVLHAQGNRVIITEVSDARKRIAKETGVADLVLDPTTDDVVARVREETDGRGADIAFDCAGVQQVFDTLLDCLGPGGHLEILAVYTKPIEFDVAGKITMQERTIGSSIGYAHNHPEAIELATNGKIDLGRFISSVIPVADIVEKGYKRLRDEGETEVKILVEMTEG